MRNFTVKFLLTTFVLTIIIANTSIYCQDSIPKVTLSLKNVVDLAIKQSSAVKYAQNQNVSYYWRYQNYSKKFLPQLKLASNLPIYKNTNNFVESLG
jgi:hypothetical protein